MASAGLTKPSHLQVISEVPDRCRGSKTPSVHSEAWDGEEEDPTRAMFPFTSEQMRAMEELARPLSLDDERPETWSARGLCKRAYLRSAQKDVWKKAKVAPEPELLAIPRCPEGLPAHLQERLSSSGLGRRMSVREQVVMTLDGKVLFGTAPCASPTGSSESSSSRSPAEHPRIQRATSLLLCVEGDEVEFGAKPEAIPEESSVCEAGGTGADLELPVQERGTAPADTGGTPPLQTGHPLRELLTAKKVNVEQLEQLLQNLSDVGHWLNTPLDHGPPVLPPPLFYAIGATLPAVVAVLLEHSADVNRRYEGQKVYHGWIKPECTPIEAVMNRRGRFVGTMLGDRLEEILELLKTAEARGKEDNLKEDVKQRLGKKLQKKLVEPVDGTLARKSIQLASAHGTVQHTQSHPSLYYDVVADLREGTLSTVNLAIHRTKFERRVIKAEMKFEEGVIWDEIAIMRKLYHPNVIELFETFEDESNIFVVLEVCAGGELFTRLATEGGVPESHAARLMQQLASAVRYIHHQHVCHRDIQPENFLLKDDRALNEATVKLIDFSTAKEFGPQSLLKTKICTLHYVAPEILTKRENPYTEKVDVWSLGVVFYVILSGCPPFFGENEVGVLKKIKRGVFKFNPPEVWSNISMEAKDLVQQMLVVDIGNRYSADDVTKHPWLSRDIKNRMAQSEQNHLSVEQLNNLRNFHARNRVQKVLQRLRAQELSNAAVDDLRAVFQRLNRDGTGEVHISDVRDKIRRVPTLNENIEEVMHVLWSLEQGTGRVNFDHFLEALVSRQNTVQKEACRAIFDVFDFDGSGTISREELKLALGLGENGAKNDSFKAGVEAVLGMSVDEIESRFTMCLDDEEYSFDKFFGIMQQGCCSRRSSEVTLDAAPQPHFPMPG